MLDASDLQLDGKIRAATQQEDCKISDSLDGTDGCRPHRSEGGRRHRFIPPTIGTKGATEPVWDTLRISVLACFLQELGTQTDSGLQNDQPVS